MRGEERQCRIVWVSVAAWNICGHGIPRLEGTDDMRVCASCGGNCRTGSSLMLPTQKLTDLLLGAGIGAVLLLAAWVSREEIGYGDGAMLMASGIFLGFWRNVELFLTALMLIVPAALFGLIVKHRRKDYRMPFLPFLFAAYVFQLGWR